LLPQILALRNGHPTLTERRGETRRQTEPVTSDSAFGARPDANGEAELATAATVGYMQVSA